MKPRWACRSLLSTATMSPGTVVMELYQASSYCACRWRKLVPLCELTCMPRHPSRSARDRNTRSSWTPATRNFYFIDCAVVLIIRCCVPLVEKQENLKKENKRNYEMLVLSFKHHVTTGALWNPICLLHMELHVDQPEINRFRFSFQNYQFRFWFWFDGYKN